jgi:hypothetical protein
MTRQPVRTALVFALLPLLFAPAVTKAGEAKPDPAAVEKAARDALTKFDKGWKDYTNEPNYGDPRWKLKVETLVRLAKAGPAAVPFLEAAAKDGSPWAPHGRTLAADAREILRGPAAVRDRLAGYDLAQMDTAQVGKAAPDFTLADAKGDAYRLGQFRGKKAVVLTFLIQDT